MPSDYCKSKYQKKVISNGKVQKIIPKLNRKERYVLQYQNLQLYLKLGIIDRLFQFKPSP